MHLQPKSTWHDKNVYDDDSDEKNKNNQNSNQM